MEKMKLLTCFSLFACLLGCSAPNTSSDSPITQEWEPLIVGDDLSSWQKMGAVQASMENGELMLKGNAEVGGNWLISPHVFENFKLKAEFLLLPPNNSGIAIRYNDPPGGDPGRSSYEINLLNEQETQNPTGSIFELARAKWQDSMEVNDWNKIELQAVGDHMVVLLNDEKITEVHDRRSLGGKIAFEAPAGEVKFPQYRNHAFPCIYCFGTVDGRLYEESSSG